LILITNVLFSSNNNDIITIGVNNSSEP